MKKFFKCLLEGMGSIFVLFPYKKPVPRVAREPLSKEEEEKEIWKAIGKDFKAVGGDLKNAMDKVSISYIEELKAQISDTNNALDLLEKVLEQHPLDEGHKLTKTSLLNRKKTLEERLGKIESLKGI